MNKTIEERANDFVNSIRKDFCKQVTEAAEKTAKDTLTAVLNVYKHSADEQRKIDTDNACEAYCNVVCQSEQTSGKRCYWRVQNERCPELESFVKAMEEE